MVVQEQRELSNEIAEKLSITHESPQVIVLEKGSVKTVFNHHDIQKEKIEEIIK